MSLAKEAKKEMATTLDHLKEDLKNLRTGRANPGLVSGVTVEVYGTSMRLTDMANITAPEAQQILITPYDAQSAGAIAKAIDASNLGLRASAEGSIVRVRVPTMDEAMRKEMTKQCRRKAEDSKISIRNSRRKYNDRGREMKAAGDLPEDQLHRLEKEIQTLTDDFCKEIDTLCTAKEKEIMAV
ncbi:MAG: ribosome recycling factor [Verrucomicrobia bacterium]|nr:ribosome recycling factor [Verrucomicrobiota bacterium]